jgi:hypothetical protein
MSLMYVLNNLSEKIYWFFSAYPLWVGELAIGVIFGILISLFFYLLTLPYVFYTLIGVFITLWLLSYSKIVFFHNHNFRKTVGIEASTMDQFSHAIKIFFEQNMIAIVVALIVSVILFRLIRK